jgi:4'-phosphopantetheinyl transferase
VEPPDGTARTPAPPGGGTPVAPVSYGMGCHGNEGGAVKRGRATSGASAGSWGPAPACPRARCDQVHVWRARLDLPAHRVVRLARFLSPDEVRRAERLFFEVDRQRFIVARGVLRTILGRYLGASPIELRFVYGPHGKPELTPEFADGRLHFSVAHSHRLALYAVAYDRQVGVDLEYMRPHLASKMVAERFFSPLEAERLGALPEKEQGEAFFCCWTRKEAYIKARGEGLSLPLDCFDVSLAPDEDPVRLRTLGDPAEATRWCLRGLAPGAGYAAAVAAEGSGWRLQRWLWSPVRRRATRR